MPSPRYRLTVTLPPLALHRVRSIAAERDISDNDVVRMAIGLLDVAERARADGHYVGTARDRESLDTLIVAPL